MLPTYSHGGSFLQFVHVSGSTACLCNIFFESKDKTYQKIFDISEGS